jgi:hypothetical protein
MAAARAPVVLQLRNNGTFCIVYAVTIKLDHVALVKLSAHIVLFCLVLAASRHQGGESRELLQCFLERCLRKPGTSHKIVSAL